MRGHRRWDLLLLLPVVLMACDGSHAAGAGGGDAGQPSELSPCAGDGALSTCLTPHHSPAYYVEQGLKYFDTLDSTADPTSAPAYSEMVARWEWPPWIKLTGLGKEQMTAIDTLIKSVEPSTVPVRDCRAFPVQPWTRCLVTIQYKAGPCPIYEEFTYNDQGETTFVEAWSLVPNLPASDAAPATVDDPWGERPGAHRLSTKVPGLGNAKGLIELDAPWMQQAAEQDPEVADLVARGKNFLQAVFDELDHVGGVDAAFAHECGWAIGE